MSEQAVCANDAAAAQPSPPAYAKGDCCRCIPNQYTIGRYSLGHRMLVSSLIGLYVAVLVFGAAFIGILRAVHCGVSVAGIQCPDGTPGNLVFYPVTFLAIVSWVLVCIGHFMYKNFHHRKREVIPV